MDARSPERILHHYQVERELADRLRRADREERRRLYAVVYDELFQRVPDHPQLTRKNGAEIDAIEVGNQFTLTRAFLKPGMTYLELGPGDCAHAKRVAAEVAKVYAVDVSDEITKNIALPANLELSLSDGTSVPVPAGSVDLAYSNQLMEHLHVEDARNQIEQIFKALKPGGMYICITPNRLAGPHDVSAFYDEEATGFHMKEYDNRDLIALFRQAGFSRFKCALSYRSLVVPMLMPLWPVTLAERFVSALPFPLKRKVGRVLLAAKFVAIR